MEEKKRGKGVKVFLVIFIVLFLAAAGALGYGYTKYKDLENENTNLNTKYENANKDLDKTKSDLDSVNDKLSSSDKNYIEISDTFSSPSKSYNLYSISRSTSVIGFNEEIYYFDLEGLSGEFNNCVERLLYEKPNFKGGKAICSPDADEDEGTGYIYETDIKEKDLYKAVSSNFPSNTGYNYIVFFILKDGSVKVKDAPNYPEDIEKKLSEYKIKDVKRFYCSSGAKDTCKYPLKLNVILQDGSEKTIDLE